MEEGFYIATGFLQDRVSRRLGMERPRRAGLAYFLTELRLEIGSMKNDGGPSGLCWEVIKATAGAPNIKEVCSTCPLVHCSITKLMPRDLDPKFRLFKRFLQILAVTYRNKSIIKESISQLSLH